jgi:hypothetical protein
MSSVYKNRQIQPRGGGTGERQSYIGDPSIFGAILLSPTSVSPICYQKPAKSVGQKVTFRQHTEMIHSDLPLGL